MENFYFAHHANNNCPCVSILSADIFCGWLSINRKIPSRSSTMQPAWMCVGLQSSPSQFPHPPVIKVRDWHRFWALHDGFCSNYVWCFVFTHFPLLWFLMDRIPSAFFFRTDKMLPSDYCSIHRNHIQSPWRWRQYVTPKRGNKHWRHGTKARKTTVICTGFTFGRRGTTTGALNHGTTSSSASSLFVHLCMWSLEKLAVRL